jgi:hypothetical protein
VKIVVEGERPIWTTKEKEANGYIFPRVPSSSIKSTSTASGSSPSARARRGTGPSAGCALLTGLSRGKRRWEVERGWGEEALIVLSRTIHRPLDLLSLVDLAPISTFNYIQSIHHIHSIHPFSPTPFLVSGPAFLLFFLSIDPLSLPFLLITLCRPILSSHASWSSSYPVSLSPTRAGSILSLPIHPSHSLSPLASCPASDSCCCPSAFPLRSSYSYSSCTVSCSLFHLSINWLVFCSIGLCTGDCLR